MADELHTFGFRMPDPAAGDDHFYRVTMDGQELQGVFDYNIRPQATGGVPVVTLSFLAAAVVELQSSPPLTQEEISAEIRRLQKQAYLTKADMDRLQELARMAQPGSLSKRMAEQVMEGTE